ncbi:dimethylaniline monooxygenase [N-oxide-forming] 2-like [Glandiceps talaboti]
MASEGKRRDRVAVVGAGVAGLVSIKSCLEEDLEPVCFERSNKIGGLWNYSDEIRPDEGAALYKSITLNTSKEMSSFSDYPFPKENAPFMSHKKVLQYLHDYAKHFDLEKHIQFNTKVVKIEKSGDGDKYWKVIHQKDDATTVEEYFDYVMVCSGMFSKRHVPTFPGLDTFEGIKIHANEYRDAVPYEDKKVVVVGGGVTAGEICCEIARNNNDEPPSILNTRSVMSCDDIQDRIIQGQLTPVVGIEEFGKNTVKLKDGTVLEDIDAVIFATGYEYSIPFIDQSLIFDDSGNIKLYRYAFPVAAEHPERIAMIGMISPFGSALPFADIQSRWACRIFNKKVHLPDREVMKKDIENKPQYTDKHYLYVPSQIVAEEIAEEIGVRPKLWKLVLSDPKLAYLYEYGPMVPYWYRLQGPGAWSGARDAILNSKENTSYSTRRFYGDLTK